ncbi:sensor histidine kinase [Geotalea uraniireducens]|uniref:histidine kinase n=1 Tax=Geotalea uraniireducens TaxID=351604 RepID=A0ABN6VU89_9BACT|nr:sensor histidine kinase [Geotalea uraniireducens]
MPNRGEKPYSRTERLVFWALILMSAFWIADTVIEAMARYSRGSVHPSLLIVYLGHLVMLLLQLVLILYVRRLFRQRQQLQREVEAAMARDVAEQRHAATAVRSEAAFFQQLLNALPTPVFYKNAACRYVLCNEAFAAFHGLPREEILGRTIFDLAPEEPARVCDASDREMLLAPGRRTVETALRGADGQPRQVLITKATILDRGGNASGVVGVFNDISEIRRSESEIRKLNRDLGQRADELAAKNDELASFGYSLSHDLTTPLTRISCATQTLADLYTNSLDEQGNYLVGSIAEGVERIESLVEAMLVLCRVGNDEMRHETVDLTRLAQRIAGELRESEPARQVEFAIAPGLTSFGDRNLLAVVMENLLGNAWKYTRQRAVARIEVGAFALAGGEAVFVRDNGVGFAMKDAARLFTVFERLHRQNDFPGSGVGLAIVQRVIERHGGRIWAEGTPGGGATFSFILPPANLYSTSCRGRSEEREAECAVPIDVGRIEGPLDEGSHVAAAEEQQGR